MNYIRVLRYICLHSLNAILVAGGFYGVAVNFNHIISILLGQSFWPPPSLQILILFYGSILCLFILPIQLGLGIASFIKFEDPPLLLLIYFQYDQEELPMDILDPTKSGIGVLVLLALLFGGYVAWPLFASYGIYYLILPLLVRPPFALEEIFFLVNQLSIAMGLPLIVYFFAVMIAIIIIERRHRRL